MKIAKMLSEYRNDFSAIMECEHCGNTQKTAGYHDNFYHTKVIPTIYCEKCNKNRAGESQNA